MRSSIWDMGVGAEMSRAAISTVSPLLKVADDGDT